MRFPGESRDPCQPWIPAFAGNAREQGHKIRTVNLSTGRLDLADCLDDSLRGLARQEVTGARYDAALIRAGKVVGSVPCSVRRRDTVGFTLQSNFRHRDRGLARELRFDFIEGRVAWRHAVPVTA